MVSQFQGDFKERDKRMSKYLKVARLLQVKFEKVKVAESPEDRIAMQILQQNWLPQLVGIYLRLSQ